MSESRSCAWVALACSAALFAVGLLTSGARAQALPLELATLPDSTELGPRVEMFRDASGALELAAVRATAKFEPHHEPVVSQGFDDAPVWVHFSARNAGALPVRWTLELSEPTLDDVRLHIVHGDGRVETRATGDMLPFSAREVGYGSFVFELENAPHTVVNYYLRAQTTMSLRVPLRAWRPAAYTAYHERENMGFCLFYGAMLVLALYNLGVFLLVRHGEHIQYVFLLLALVLVQMCLRGDVSLFLLPNHPQLANRLLPVSLALALLGVALFSHEVLRRVGDLPLAERFASQAGRVSALLLLFALSAPIGLSMRVLCAVVLLVALCGPVIVHRLNVKRHPELRLYHYSWYALIVAVPVAVLSYARLIPPWPFTGWALQLGFTLHGLAISLALASWVDSMRGRVSDMNVQLSDNVSDLQRALAEAERSNEQAQRATRAKDEFMATMSHELRTPLNTIINIPQGLIGEFQTVRAAKCTSCRASYLLDERDELGPTVACEGCGQVGTLCELSKPKFQGDEARLLRFLQKIERSGQHLLQMVNGILDYTKLEAGRFELTLAPVDVEELLREVNDQVVDLAQPKSIALVMVPVPPSGRPVMADFLRLKQVLINLVANAIKFSEPGSTVTVRWASLPDAERITVEDQGIGIAPADHERIFGSFEQVHTGDTRKYGGTGLGLSISRSLVRMHGGELTVESALGRGATFVVRLPRLPTSALLLGTSTLELVAKPANANAIADAPADLPEAPSALVAGVPQSSLREL